MKKFVSIVLIMIFMCSIVLGGFTNQVNAKGNKVRFGKFIKQKMKKHKLRINKHKELLDNTSARILGFSTYYYEGDRESYNSIEENSETLDEVVVATYNTDKYGNLEGVIPQEQMNIIKKEKIFPILLVGNHMDGEISKSILEIEENQINFIRNVIRVMKNNGFKGINIDFEGVYFYNRHEYVKFLKEIKKSFKQYKYKLTVSIPGKDYDDPKASWNGAFDYEAIGKVVDSVVIMTYDEHYMGGEPGPIASIDWVNRVMNFAISKMSRDKIYLGLSAYGYDWGKGIDTQAYTLKDMLKLANQYERDIKWDNETKSSYFYYIDKLGIEHEVWFESPRAIEFKLNIVKKLDIKGVAIWRLGQETEEYWNKLRELKN